MYNSLKMNKFIKVRRLAFSLEAEGPQISQNIFGPGRVGSGNLILGQSGLGYSLPGCETFLS